MQTRVWANIGPLTKTTQLYVQNGEPVTRLPSFHRRAQFSKSLCTEMLQTTRHQPDSELHLKKIWTKWRRYIFFKGEIIKNFSSKYAMLRLFIFKYLYIILRCVL